jgi:hypothetical protein
MKVAPRPKALLGTHVVQCAVEALQQVIGALQKPAESHLLLWRGSLQIGLWRIHRELVTCLESCGLWKNRGVQFCWELVLVQM